jgi:cytochrome b subunit of formate dehydrogenase
MRHTVHRSGTGSRTEHWIAAVRSWIMPVFAGITAAFGGYLGVVRSIDALRTEIRVMQAEHRTEQTLTDRRLRMIEDHLPRDLVTRRDIAGLEDRLRREIERAVERHEQTSHERMSR